MTCACSCAYVYIRLPGPLTHHFAACRAQLAHGTDAVAVDRLRGHTEVLKPVQAALAMVYCTMAAGSGCLGSPCCREQHELEQPE